ncbi:MAG: hypothetical protein ACI83Y_001231 [Candidatus Azotimanducaceae bacterium]|jgi:hypothetical protein
MADTQRPDIIEGRIQIVRQRLRTGQRGKLRLLRARVYPARRPKR